MAVTRSRQSSDAAGSVDAVEKIPVFRAPYIKDVRILCLQAISGPLW